VVPGTHVLDPPLLCGRPLYEFDWAHEQLWEHERRRPAAVESGLPRERVAETLLVHWQEHCVECAPPQCYAVCPLYVARGDRKCARFVYGVYPNPEFRGLLDRGADVRFRRWAKIETELYGKAVSVPRHRRHDRLDGAVTRGVNAVARALEPLSRRRRLNGALTQLRGGLLRRLPASQNGGYDDFVLECYAPDEEAFRLILEYVPEERPALRHAFEIEPGHNFHTLPAGAFGRLTDRGRVLIYPEDDAERRVIFTWLDFVRYASPAVSPAGKVKCVAWDLDNTLWDGTLLEDGPDGCRLRPEVRALIDRLDERGILQTVVSKNNHEDAWALVERLGLQDHFLYPAINWGQKSANLKQVAERLNIGVDTLALVDDSPFERAEVEAALPMMRVYSPGDLPGLLERPELDVPVTEMSRKRRLSYLAEMERGRALELFSGDYLEFLRSCGLKMRLFVPREEAHVRRCLELVQRSNQLNLSGARYSEEEFRALLVQDGVLCAAVECEDRFGHYGIVGFATVDERPDVPVVLDYVLSCRVAQKRVEHTFFQWLAVREGARGAPALRAQLVRTERNGPLVQVLEELPFAAVEEDGPRRLLEMPLDSPRVDDVIELRDDVEP
jgi:FkbH-like protein